MDKSSGARKVITAGIGYVLGGILIKGCAFITTPIFSRILSTEEFGVFNTYLSYESILAMIIGFQFASCLKTAKIEYVNTPHGLDTFFSNLVALLLIHSAIAFIIINLFSKFIMHFTGISSLLLLNLLVINCFGNAAMTIYNSYVSLNYQYKKYVAISLFNAILNVAVSLILILTVMQSDKSTARVLGYVIPYIIISIYVVIIAFRKARPDFCHSNHYNSFAYRYCTPLIPNGFSEVMLVQFSKLMVERSCGLSTMGIYSLAYNVYSIVATVKLGMDYIVGPFYFEKRHAGKLVELRKIFQIYSRFLALISILIMLFSNEIVWILGDVEYYDARISAIPLIASSFFNFLCYTVSQEEYYSKKTYLISIVSIITMAINIFLCIIVVPHRGALGAAFCTLGSFVFMFFFHYIIIKLVLKSDAFNWRNLFLDSIFVVGMTIASLLVIDNIILRIVMIVLIMCLITIYALKNFRSVIQIKKQGD